MTIWAILPAAGIGHRMGSITPKQYLPVNGVPVIARSLEKLAAVSAIAEIVVVLHPQDCHWPELNLQLDTPLSTTEGGEQRQQSVLNGLNHLAPRASMDDWVLVHDAARPCVRSSDIETLIQQLQHHAVGGLLGSPVDNTLKQVDEDGLVQATVDRTQLWNALTPQMFRYGLLKSAIEQAIDRQLVTTDEASALELQGHRPKIIEGSRDNIKLTTQQDLQLAAEILRLQVATT